MANGLFKALDKTWSLLFGQGKPSTDRPADAPATVAVSVEATGAVPAASSPRGGEPSPPKRPRSVWRRMGHLAKEIVVRIYSLGVLLLVAWAGYLAVTYLVDTVFVEKPVSRRLLDWEGRSDVAALRSQDVPGLSGPAERAPLGHFHHVDPWFQPDPRNGCTVSGCHDPLPHTNKVSAFANFHTTFLACQMCHSPADDKAGEAAWVSLSDARRQDPPAILRLIRYLETETEQIRSNPTAAHQVILPLLRSTLTAIGHDAALESLLLQIDTSEPDSPVWRMAVAQLTRELPAHARGDYAAKVAREPAPGAYQQTAEGLRDLAEQYLAERTDAGRRRELHQAIHGSLLQEPTACVSCHSVSQKTMDYEALGYSAARAKVLRQLQLARLMQQIRQGEQFFIPRLLESGNGR